MFTAKYEIYSTQGLYCGEVLPNTSADKARYKAMAEVAKMNLALKQKKIIPQYAVVKCYNADGVLISTHKRTTLGITWKEVQDA